jgi:hypothetical protein
MKLSFIFAHLLVCAAAYSPLAPAGKASPQVNLKNDISRRNLLASAVLVSSSLLINPSMATASSDLVEYKDKEFSMSAPSDWEKSFQSQGSMSPDRRKIVLYMKPNSDQKTLLSLGYTPLAPDYASLDSFGSIDQIEQQMILPKGQIGGAKDTESVMLNTESKKSAYFFDYKQKIPGQPEVSFK